MNQTLVRPLQIQKTPSPHTDGGSAAADKESAPPPVGGRQ